jgi:hypothetical protein
MSSGLTGNWGRVNVFLNNLKRSKYKEEALITIGDTVVQQIRRNIEQQLLDFPELVARYHRRKVSEGYDPRILIRTGDFLDSIVVTDVSVDGDTYSIKVGVSDGLTESKLPMSDLAYYIEHGTIKQPGRFPFALTWEGMRSRLKQDIVQQIKVELEEGM